MQKFFSAASRVNSKTKSGDNGCGVSVARIDLIISIIFFGQGTCVWMSANGDVVQIGVPSGGDVDSPDLLLAVGLVEIVISVGGVMERLVVYPKVVGGEVVGEKLSLW
jgi:hypothetical protein